MRFLVVFLLAAIAFAGCESTSTPKAPAVTAAMANPGGRQQIDLALLNAGRSAFVTRCAGCHALPGVNEHSRDEWPGIVTAMAKRSGLKTDQREAVIAYILAAHTQ